MPRGASMTPTQHITLDVSRPSRKSVAVWLREGDSNGTILVVDVTQDGEPFDCSEYTPFLMLPMGDDLYRQEGSVDGNVVTICVDESKLGNYSGLIGDAYISLEGDGVTASTYGFDVRVHESANDGGAPESYVSDLDALYVRAESMIEALERYDTGFLDDEDMDEIFN